MADDSNYDLSALFTQVDSSQNPGFAHLTDPAATTETVFTDPNQGPPALPPTPDPNSIDPSTGQPMNFGARLGSAIAKSGQTIGKLGGSSNYKEYGFTSVPRELYSRGFDNPTERAQPVSRSRPAQSEDARAVWHQWYNDMKAFANNGK